MTQTYVGTTARTEVRLPDNWAEHDQEASVDEKKDKPSINVGDSERVKSLLGGVALAFVGFKMRGLLGLGLIGAGTMIAKRGYTGHCELYQKLGKNTAEPAEPEQYFKRGIHVDIAMTIARPRADLFSYWRDFKNLPRFMSHVQSIQVQDNMRSHWVVKAPAGMTAEWDAEIIHEEPDRLISWRSLGGATVDNTGTVRFDDAPGDRGTEVRVVLDYIPPAGVVGKWVAMLFGEAPELTIKEDLRRFKRLMEAGDIPTIEGQSKGVCGCSSAA